MSKKPGVKGMSRKQRAATMIAIKEQQAGRSPRAVSMDARQTARRLLDPETDNLHPWQKHPNRYDVQGVDARTGTVSPEPEKAKFDPETIPTYEEFYRREYWQDPKTGRHPASGSGRLQINETAHIEVTTVGGEPIIKMYNPWTKEEKYFELEEMETAKKEFKDLYQNTFGPQAKKETITLKTEPTKPEAESIKIITNKLPDGYEIHKWSYVDHAGKQTVHAVLFEGKPVFGQNKTFGSLTDARKAVKEHADTQRLHEQIRKEREYFEKHGHLGNESDTRM